MAKNKRSKNKAEKSTAVLAIGLALILLLVLGILITVYFRANKLNGASEPGETSQFGQRNREPQRKTDGDKSEASESEREAGADRTSSEKSEQPENAEPAQTGAEAEETEPPASSPEELKAVVTAEELASLDLSGIRRVDLTGSTCYAEIEAFRAEHPELEVVYAVMIGDQMQLAPDTKSIHISDVSVLPALEENAAWLPELSALSLDTDIAGASEIEALKAAFPKAAVSYSLTLNGMQYPYDIEEIRLTGLDAEGLLNILPELDRFPNLRSVSIPEAENTISAEDALAAAQQYPLLTLDYQIELFGHSVSLAAESLEFENEEIGSEGVEELRAILPSFKNLKYLKLDSCGIDNETMAQLRDDFPDIKVVWRVFFGEYHCLTDTEMIWATGGSVNDSSVGVLKYCTDVKYLDLGHALMTHVDFLAYMPKLEVAILAISWIEDIGPIANCPNLEYLELFSTRVMDFSPLASCTHLQHLNISHSWNANNETIGPRDISPLYDLPELKRFYCTMCYVPEEQQQIMQERHPDCECNFKWEDPAEGPWRFDENGNRNERYALLCEQFGYDTYQQSGKVWSLY